MQIRNLRKIWGHPIYWGHVRIFVGRVTVRFGSKHSDLALKVRPKPKPNRNLTHKYPNMTKSTLYDPKFCVDSKSALRIGLTARGREFEPQTRVSGQASQIGIPTRPDRTEPIFEFSTKF